MTAGCPYCRHGCTIDAREGAAGTCPQCGAAWVLMVEWTAEGDEGPGPEGQKEKQN